MEKQGYILLHRQLQDNDLWLLEPFTRGQAWVDLILLANHNESSFMIRGNLIVVKRGQIAWSEESLARRYTWSRNKLRNFLKMLKTKQQIEQQKTAAINIITIINYDKFQKTKQQTEQQKDNRLNNRKTHTNNVNNDNNVNNKNIYSKANVQNFQATAKEIIDHFNFINGTSLVLTNKKTTQIKERLKVFSIEQIKTAIENRLKSKFHMGDNSEGKLWHKDWNSLFRNDEKIERFLNDTEKIAKKYTHDELKKMYESQNNLI